jgi:hypothetical protein
MVSHEKNDDALDQSRDVIAVQARLADGNRIMSRSDQEILRRLAADVAELAVQPIQAEKRRLWTRHNALVPTRPLVFCDPENGWKEIITPDQIECENLLARQWEMHLRKEIFWGTQMKDDYTIQPTFDVAHIHGALDWGLKETRIGGGNDGAYTWVPPIKTEADLEKLHYPEIAVDHTATERLRITAEEIFGDLLTVRVKTLWWWSLGMTRLLAELRGLQQIMVDVYENPDLLHGIMTILKDGTLVMLDGLEEQGLLCRNDDGTYVGSGGLGWTNELPPSDLNGKVRCANMWGFCESQETVGVSPDTFAEFVFPYQEPILARFGLNCYGCCEPLDKRWHIIKKIANLRRLSVSPWADKEKMAQQLEDNYIYSLKPSPADLAMADFDEHRIRQELREVLAITRNCCVELVMKDNHTIRKDPRRVIRWVQIAREESENV